MDMRKFNSFVQKKGLWLLALMLFAVFSVSAVTIRMNSSQIKKARAEFVKTAKTLVGTPYVYGGTDPRPKSKGGSGGFDCSGFVGYVVKSTPVEIMGDGDETRKIRIVLPRRAEDIYNCKWVKKLEKSELAPGDLVFFKTTSSGRISHVGIYIGGANKQFISALSDGPNAGVVVSSLNQDYWKPRYLGAGRIL